MDSITQLTLGAAIGEAALGKKAGNKAAIWGGIYGTLPDLDFLVPFEDAVATFTYHRSVSHSLLVLAVVSPFFAWLMQKIHPSLKEFKWHCLLLVFLTFQTHALLDGFTVYGTQLLWPLYIYPVSWSTIFIIDPMYTIPLMTGVISALRFNRDKNTGRYMNYAGLVFSSFYLCWTVTAKLYMQSLARDSLQEQGIEYTRVLTTPAPMNSIVWRIIAMDENGYYDGYHSILSGRDEIDFRYYESESSLLDGIEDHWPVQRLIWFTHGFYKVSRVRDNILMTDLRMGQEPDYVFNFKVAELGDGKPVPVTSVLYPDLE